MSLRRIPENNKFEKFGEKLHPRVIPRYRFRFRSSILHTTVYGTAIRRASQLRFIAVFAARTKIQGVAAFTAYSCLRTGCSAP